MDKDAQSLQQKLAEERQQREQLERAWGDANRRLENAFQLLRVGSFTWRPQVGSVDWNEGFSMLHGFDHVAIKPVYKDLLARIPEQHHEGIKARVIDAMNNPGATFDLTYPVIWPDSTEHWILTRGSWEFNAQGEPITLFGFAMDADEQIRAEQQLAESERRLQEAQAAGGVGVWDFHIPTQDAHVSDEYLRMHGFDDTNYSFTHYRKYVPEDDLLLQREALARASVPGTDYDVEHRIIHAKTGEIRWVHGHGTAEFDEQGEMIRLMGTTQDITERKLAEMRLQDSTRLFHTLTQASPTLIFRFDESGDVTFVNEDRWSEFSGREANAWQDGGWLHAFHPEDRERAELEWSQAAKERVPYQGEFRWQHLSGEVRWLLFHALPVYGDDGFGGFVGTGMDVTALKESEQESSKLQLALADSQKMEAIGTLASGVAHDFNNLLAGLRGFVELAALDIDADSKAGNYLTQAQAAIDQARNVTEGLLTFARRNPANKRQFVLNDLITQNMDLLRKLVPASISFETKLPKEEVLLFADETQIRQTLVNLVVNARDAMPEGGELLVELTATNDVATLTIADSGHGMDEATMDRVFEPFFTTKPHGQGTGLGLSIAHGIIDAHGGSLQLQSNPDRGTLLTVILPRTYGESDDSVHTSLQPDHLGQGQRILIVEDNDLVRESHTLRISAGGYEVHGVRDGQEALAHLQLKASEPYDAIIMDVDLPGDNGVVLAKRIRQDLPELPVVYITGNVRNRALAESGDDPVLAKPVEFVELFRILHSFFH